MPGKKFKQIENAFNAEKEKTQKLFSSIIACVESKFQLSRLMLLVRILDVNRELKMIEKDLYLSTGLIEITRDDPLISCPMLEKMEGLQQVLQDYGQRVGALLLVEQPGERFDESQLEQAKLDLETYKLDHAQLRSSLMQWLYGPSMPLLEEAMIFIFSWRGLSEEVLSEYEFSIMDARLRLLSLSEMELIGRLNGSDRDHEDGNEIISDDVVSDFAWQLLGLGPDENGVRQDIGQRLAMSMELLWGERAQLEMEFSAAEMVPTQKEIVSAITQWFQVNEGLEGLEGLESQKILESLESEDGFDLTETLEFIQNQVGQVGLNELLVTVFNPGNVVLNALAAQMELFRADFLQIELELMVGSQLLARTLDEQGGLGGRPSLAL